MGDEVVEVEASEELINSGKSSQKISLPDKRLEGTRTIRKELKKRKKMRFQKYKVELVLTGGKCEIGDLTKLCTGFEFCRYTSRRKRQSFLETFFGQAIHVQLDSRLLWIRPRFVAE
ncbi:unnamed protein product [Onchocerca ochengi]|uniref:MADS-box domain-containing protein n=1 Tax=Onchocerca ochengi TaxID=42157 RepID=A0A182DWM1_ONCOC|nr:unnamed protein product [Onchocerca ochengi]